jgi:hypothetical protein
MAGLFGAHRRLLFVWMPSDGVAAGKHGLMAGGLERLSISLRMLAFSRIKAYVLTRGIVACWIETMARVYRSLGSALGWTCLCLAAGSREPRAC